MKRGWIVLGCAGLLAALVPALAQQRTEWLRKRRANFMVQHIVHDLNLSDGQRMQIKTILRNEQPKIQALLKQSQVANEELRSRQQFDEAFVRSVAQRQSATVVESIVEREKIRSEIMAVLSPDQQRKFNTIAGEFRTAVGTRLATLGDEL